MKYRGIDLHSNNSVVTVTDEADRVVAEKRLPNGLGKHPKGTVVDILFKHVVLQAKKSTPVPLVRMKILAANAAMESFTCLTQVG